MLDKDIVRVVKGSQHVLQNLVSLGEGSQHMLEKDHTVKHTTETKDTKE